MKTKSITEDSRAARRSFLRTFLAGLTGLFLLASHSSAQSLSGWDASIPAPDLGVPLGNPPGTSFGSPPVPIMAAAGNSLFIIVNYWNGTSAELRIEQWTVGSESWEVIGKIEQEGNIYTVYASGGYLYAGGSFGISGGSALFTAGGDEVNASGIAKYDIDSGTWSGMDYPSTNAVVYAITVDNGQNVYVGTAINSVNPPLSGNCDPILLEQRSGSSVWATNGGGLIRIGDEGQQTVAAGLVGVTALATDGTNIYAGGTFDGAYNNLVIGGSGTLVSSYDIIEWDGSSWHSVGTNGLVIAGDAGIQVNALAISGTNIFLTGNFFGSDGFTEFLPIGLAHFTTSGDGPDGPGLLQSSFVCPSGPYGTTGVGYALAVLNGVVYVSGSFDSVGLPDTNNPSNFDGTPAFGIAQWEYGRWSGLGCDVQGLTYSSTTWSGYACNRTYQDYGVAAGTNAVFVVGTFDTAGGCRQQMGSRGGRRRTTQRIRCARGCWPGGVFRATLWIPSEITMGCSSGRPTSEGRGKLVMVWSRSTL